MKKTLKRVLATTILALTCSVAFAEHEAPKTDSSPETTALPLIMPCNKSERIFSMLQAEQFQESPIAIGDGSVFRPNNTPVPGQLTLWHNPKDKLNFSIVFTIGGTDVSCIVASGVKLEFVPSAFGNPI